MDIIFYIIYFLIGPISFVYLLVSCFKNIVDKKKLGLTPIIAGICFAISILGPYYLID